jgi:hypothetical protein
VETFHRRHGHANVPRNYRDEHDTPVGEWVAKQRQLAKAGKLAAPRLKRLGALGVVGESRLDIRLAACENGPSPETESRPETKSRPAPERRPAPESRRRAN